MTEVRKHLTADSGFTSHAKDWILMYQENFIDKLSALERENEIKSWKKPKELRHYLSLENQ